ncbi:hypothetical protein CDEST_07732 [Colletotrichum destructivum]|uniref:Biotrophy-associated secreted protein 3 n=1 Tax=Colletotrichum destructivum TaxID=34406 RepID=A0AAX4IIU9_9PEZI|nr:hypothetical protein CDEST_07732 [Colletotrichum destructivum]
MQFATVLIALLPALVAAKNPYSNQLCDGDFRALCLPSSDGVQRCLRDGDFGNTCVVDCESQSDCRAQCRTQGFKNGFCTIAGYVQRLPCRHFPRLIFYLLFRSGPCICSGLDAGANFEDQI